MNHIERAHGAAQLLARRGYSHIDPYSPYPLGVWQHNADGRRVVLQSNGYILSGVDLQEWVRRNFPDQNLRMSSYTRNWG